MGRKKHFLALCITNFLFFKKLMEVIVQKFVLNDQKVPAMPIKPPPKKKRLVMRGILAKDDQ
jgi:hypothetical protein